MDKLAQQVKSELIRTFIWLAIALAVGIGLFYLIW
jgi:hypothetical protein